MPLRQEFTPKAHYFVTQKQASCGCIKSKPQMDLADFVKSLGFEVAINDRSLIYPMELDIYVPEKNLGIEYHGLYWHSEAVLKDRAANHHVRKFMKCQEKGISLIQIFSDEWLCRPDVVKSKLKSILGLSDRKIGARECQVVIGKSLEFKDFLQKYHLQGYASGVGIGLKFEGELVAVMTAKQTEPRVWDINRYCIKEGVALAGGFTRLLSHFQKSVAWDKMVTFADLRWSTGRLYEKSGFTLEHVTAPSYWYFELGSDAGRFHKSNFRKEKIEQKFGLKIPEGVTEWEIMQDLGYDRIWDAGKQKWVLENKAPIPLTVPTEPLS